MAAVAQGDARRTVGAGGPAISPRGARRLARDSRCACLGAGPPLEEAAVRPHHHTELAEPTPTDRAGTFRKSALPAKVEMTAPGGACALTSPGASTAEHTTARPARRSCLMEPRVSRELARIFGISLAHLWPAFTHEVTSRSIVSSLRSNPFLDRARSDLT
jgi:hypothetical protein